MADIDRINVIQDSVITTYFIKDSEGRRILAEKTSAQTPDTEISLLRMGFSNQSDLTPFTNSYDAINAIVPRWKVCQ